MEYNEEDDDIKLAKASAGLLADLESCLPKLLWKPSRTKAERGRVHSHVRRKDLDYVINLVCSCLCWSSSIAAQAHGII
jgi:hypothetical protein